MAKKSDRPKGLYERLLAEKRLLVERGTEEESRGKLLASSRIPDSPVLKELEEKATPAQPGYMRDLHSLHRLIKHGGPDNWASSMWFGFLTGQYPGEYERLREEHLGKGQTLREGFRHGRTFAREELEGVNVDEEDLVFCHSAPYDSFWHEADVLLVAAAREVERGALTPREARRLLEPYRDVLPLIYSDMQKAIFDPARTGWSKEDSFPRADEVRRNPPASAIFWYEADDLGIRDVGFTVWATPHPIFEVMSARALRALREAVAGKYKIVVKNDYGDYIGPSLGLRDAVDLLDQAAISGDKSRGTRAR